MNKITMICKEDDNSKTVVERTAERSEDLDIYFIGRCFYEFLMGIGFNERIIEKILKTEDL
ncbi:MAG: hypothetical protein PHT02_00705 [Tissierellia bacterium]|nr:hypothetical protein [Tissierellia bacterium]